MVLERNKLSTWDLFYPEYGHWHPVPNSLSKLHYRLLACDLGSRKTAVLWTAAAQNHRRWWEFVPPIPSPPFSTKPSWVRILQGYLRVKAVLRDFDSKISLSFTSGCFLNKFIISEPQFCCLQNQANNIYIIGLCTKCLPVCRPQSKPSIKMVVNDLPLFRKQQAEGRKAIVSDDDGLKSQLYDSRVL